MTPSGFDSGTEEPFAFRFPPPLRIAADDAGSALAEGVLDGVEDGVFALPARGGGDGGSPRSSDAYAPEWSSSSR